jgi:hypothetical protein
VGRSELAKRDGIVGGALAVEHPGTRKWYKGAPEGVASRTSMRTVSAVDPASRLEFCTPGLLDSLVETQTRLRLDYRNIPAAPEETARDFLRSITSFLEFLYLSAVGIEVAHRHGASTAEDIATNVKGFFREIGALTKLSPDKVFQENIALVTSIQRNNSKASEPQSHPFPELAKVVSAVSSILQASPLADLVELATSLQMTEHGSRCQVAFDGLRHFTRRNDTWMHQRLKVVGLDYTLGQSSVEQVAEVLALPIADTVAMLEDHGFARPVSNVTLTEESRSNLYECLRQDRAKRAGKPQGNPQRVARSVIASQRIEGIDARPWVDANAK